MRMLDGLLKALGVLILLSVALLLPLTVIAQQALHTVYDASVLTAAVEANWLDAAALTSMGQAYARTRVQHTPANDPSLLFWRALNALEPSQWHVLVAYLAPREALHAVVASAARALIAWLQAPNAPPEAPLTLAPWKQAVQANAGALSAWLLGQFRECSVPETARWAEAVALNDWSQPPLCIPLGTSRRVEERIMTLGVTTGLKGVPDSVNLLDARVGLPEALQAAKTGLLQARHAEALAWLVVAVLGVLGAFLVARSPAGWWTAWGVTLLAAGVPVIAAGLAERLLARQVLANAAAQVPPWAWPNVQGTVMFYAHRVLHPLIFWGAGMGAVGGAAAAAGWFFGARRRPRAQAAFPRR